MNMYSRQYYVSISEFLLTKLVHTFGNKKNRKVNKKAAWYPGATNISP